MKDCQSAAYNNTQNSKTCNFDHIHIDGWTFGKFLAGIHTSVVVLHPLADHIRHFIPWTNTPDEADNVRVVQFLPYDAFANDTLQKRSDEIRIMTKGRFLPTR